MIDILQIKKPSKNLLYISVLDGITLKTAKIKIQILLFLDRYILI